MHGNLAALRKKKGYIMNNFTVGQKIRMTLNNSKRVLEGVIVDVQHDRVRATANGEKDDGIGFGFHLRALDRFCVVEVI